MWRQASSCPYVTTCTLWQSGSRHRAEGEEGHVEAGLLLPICYYMHTVAVRVKAQGGGGHILACAHGQLEGALSAAVRGSR